VALLAFEGLMASGNTQQAGAEAAGACCGLV
jgi:hypothetical protein